MKNGQRTGTGSLQVRKLGCGWRHRRWSTGQSGDEGKAECSHSDSPFHTHPLTKVMGPRTPSTGQNLEKQELSCITRGQVNCCSHFGGQFGDSYRSWASSCSPKDPLLGDFLQTSPLIFTKLVGGVLFTIANCLPRNGLWWGNWVNTGDSYDE